MRDRQADVVVVGAGVLGLAHAWHARRAGLDVVVVERDEQAVGASVRNFGHVCTTAQAGEALRFAREAREDWLRLRDEAGLAVRETGTVVVARTDAELATLEQFEAERGSDAVRLLDADETAARLGFAPPELVGGAHLVQDLRVDAPATLPALAAHLEALGVDIRWRANVLEVGEECVRTTRGTVRADQVIVTVGHDVDRFFPALADAVGVRRCRLRMLEVDAPRGAVVDPAVLTGTSILRYAGLAAMPAAAVVRADLAERSPALLDADVNLMLTQRPDGRIVLGDTHRYSVTEPPFEEESLDRLLLAEGARLFGEPLTVRRRWRGVYASSATASFLVAEPQPGVTAVSVTSGIGMTCSFGLARSVLSDLLVA